MFFFANEIRTFFYYLIIHIFFELIETVNSKRSKACRIVLFLFGYLDYFFRIYLINFSSIYFKICKKLFSLVYFPLIPKIFYYLFIYNFSIIFLPIWWIFLLCSIHQFLCIGIFFYSFQMYKNTFSINSLLLSYEIKICFLIYSFYIGTHFLVCLIIIVIEILIVLFKQAFKASTLLLLNSISTLLNSSF